MLTSLLENWVLKVLSLVFALVLWFFVMGERKLERGYNGPLELKNLPVGLMVANEVPSLVDVRISGPRTLLVNLGPTELSIVVDLKGLKPGVTTFRRLEERVNLPGGLRVTRLSPSFVDVKLERVKTREVPVKVALVGEPAAGYRVGRVLATPLRVHVEGAEGEIKDVREIGTEEVSVEGHREGFTLVVPLTYTGKYSRIIDDPSVEIAVEIVKEPSGRRSRKQ